MAASLHLDGHDLMVHGTILCVPWTAGGVFQFSVTAESELSEGDDHCKVLRPVSLPELTSDLTEGSLLSKIIQFY